MDDAQGNQENTEGNAPTTLAAFQALQGEAVHKEGTAGALKAQYDKLLAEQEKAAQTGEFVESCAARVKAFEAENTEFIAGLREDEVGL